MKQSLRHWIIGFAVCGLGLVCVNVRADLLIEVGNHVVDANAATQTVTVSISGGDLILAYEVLARIGPLNGPGPRLVGVDTDSGTIFESLSIFPPADLNKAGLSDPDRVGGQNSFLIAPVSGDGVIATLVFDTTGIADGTYPLMLGEVLLEDGVTQDSAFDGTSGATIPATIINGTVTLDTSALIPGDADLDDDVDLVDLGILANNYAQSGRWAEGDFNADGLVDLLDLTILGTFFGTGAAADLVSFQEAITLVGLNAAVPEPSSVLGGITVGWFLHRRRRRVLKSTG